MALAAAPQLELTRDGLWVRLPALTALLALRRTFEIPYAAVLSARAEPLGAWSDALAAGGVPGAGLPAPLRQGSFRWQGRRVLCAYADPERVVQVAVDPERAGVPWDLLVLETADPEGLARSLIVQRQYRR
jgi:hypothetical protein